ncbi:MAG: ComEC/Rec2 family competence protein [bacterium]|nr:ComEC/Rec2 family competence protein [bacterium]
MSRKNYIFLILFLALVFALRLGTYPRPYFSSGTKIKITSTLHEEPKISGQTQVFSVQGLKVRTWRESEIHFGDRIELVGVVKEGGMIEKVETLKILTKDEGSLRGRIFNFRSHLETLYRRFFPEPQASLLSGIVLGSKQAMPKDFYNNLQKTGTLHIVVASGMNVAIIGSTLLSFFMIFFRRPLALVISFLGIWGYVLLAGAEIPVVRAGMMASLAFMAQGLGREDDGWRGLGVAAIILLLIDPLAILELSFQLSFAATMGIIYFGPKLSKLLSRLPKQIVPDLSQTLGAQIATMPIILFNFGQYSPLSPLTNILVAWNLSIIMKLGAIVAIFGLIWAPIGQLVAWILWPLLTYFVKVVELFS